MALRQKVQLRVKKYGLVLSQINQKTARSQGSSGDRVWKTGSCWIWAKRVL